MTVLAKTKVALVLKLSPSACVRWSSQKFFVECNTNLQYQHTIANSGRAQFSLHLYDAKEVIVEQPSVVPVWLKDLSLSC